MKLTREEKYAFLFLSLVLFTGAVLFQVRCVRGTSRINVTTGGLSEEYSLEEVKEILRKKRKVDINHAERDQLEKIPYIGKVLACRIISFREINGKFIRIEDIAKVKGIGPEKLKKITDYVKL